MATKPFVAMAFKKICYGSLNPKYLKSIVQIDYSILLAGISLEKSSTSHPVTGTIMVKPECLAHCCVEQGLLYPYITLAGLNFTEAKTIVFLYLLQYNFTQRHFLHFQTVGGKSIEVNM